MSSEFDKSGASSAEQSAGKPAQSINFGVQPLDGIMEEAGLKNHALVAASKDGLTHKQVNKGRKGRRLSRNVRDKIVAALSAVTDQQYSNGDLFTYK
jgi:hypothetical protein